MASCLDKWFYQNWVHHFIARVAAIYECQTHGAHLWHEYFVLICLLIDIILVQIEHIKGFTIDSVYGKSLYIYIYDYLYTYVCI